MEAVKKWDGAIGCTLSEEGSVEELSPSQLWESGKYHLWKIFENIVANLCSSVHLGVKYAFVGIKEVSLQII